MTTRKNILVALIAIFLISGCAQIEAKKAADATATAIAMATFTPLPSPTNTPTSTPTNTPIPTPTNTPIPIIFRDDFNGQLAEGWKWVRESKDYWSLTKNPGWLHLDLMGGSIYEASIRNLLMYPAPSGNFELEAKIRFQPTFNYQNAGIFIYQSNASFVHFNRAFCDQGQCVHDGLYFDSGENGNFSKDNYATILPSSDTVYLRLTKRGTLFTASYSMDGEQWAIIGTHTNSLSPTLVGIEAGQARRPISAEFDYFQIVALP